MVRYRLLTFNIAHARGALPLHPGLRSAAKLRSNLLKIARPIQRPEAASVALQETDHTPRRRRTLAPLAALSHITGLGHPLARVNTRQDDAPSPP